jgi:hypothetical protein
LRFGREAVDRARTVEVAGDRGHQPFERLGVELILPTERVQELGLGRPAYRIAVVVGQREVGGDVAVAVGA